MDAWIRGRDRDTDPDVRLLCLPPAGGCAGAYRCWQRMGDDRVEVLAAQLPGRGDRLGEPACASVEEVADGLLVALDPWLDRPLALFGHSMGALVAYELAARLEHVRGLPVALLAVAGAAPPSFDVRTRARAFLDGAGDLGERLRLAGGVPDRVFEHPGLFELMLPVIRADLEALSRYRHDLGRPLLTCPVQALAGHDDVVAPPGVMAAWSAVTTGRLSCRTFFGGHFFVGPHAADVLAGIEAALLASAPVQVPA
jgi:surfactin synthase thioesterase subunit